MLKKIISYIITFFAGVIIACGILFFFYCKASSGYEKRIATANSINESIKRDYKSAIDRLVDTQKKLDDITKSSGKSIEIIRGIRDSQQRLADRLNQGIEEK